MQMELRAEKLTQSAGALPHGRPLFSIDLHWKGPSLHTIMGASGAGKSSFLKTLGGVWKARSGTLEISGYPFESEAGKTTRRDHIGFAFQNNALFTSRRVIENLTFPHRLRYPDMSEGDRLTLARSWLERVDLLKAENLYPDELSGGMQKRLGMARALILNPKFLFLDDPTAGLDPITSRSIADVLIDLLKESSALTVLVTNDAERAEQWGGSLHFLEHGRLISQDDPEYHEVSEAYL